MCICQGKQIELARRQYYQQDSDHFSRQEVIKCQEKTLQDGHSTSTEGVVAHQPHSYGQGGSQGAGTVNRVGI